MRGKTVVITGGTSGIGEVAAEKLAKRGARIILVARDKTRGDATLARLRNCSPGVAHSIYFADLTRLAEMKRVAAEIADQEQRIDVLINNAGALFARRRLTQDGLEFTFALNHIAYFVLTEGLRERILASRPDFALWARACETALWPAGSFARAYAANRTAAIEGLIEADPVATCVRELMAEREHVDGTRRRPAA
jgi:NAD(P)-dependent dehydrogenase (short-subunit alcohol dehydrogenase family)